MKPRASAPAAMPRRLKQRARRNWRSGGMTCASCAMRVEKALAKVPGVTRASANLATSKPPASISNDATSSPDALIAAAVKKAGYDATLIAPPETAAPAGRRPPTPPPRPPRAPRTANATSRAANWRPYSAWVQAVLTLPLVAPMVGEWFAHARDAVLPSLQFALASIVQFRVRRALLPRGLPRRAGRRGQHGPARRAGHVGGLRDQHLRTSRCIRATRCICTSEASAVVITLVRFGKWLEARAKRQTTDAIRALNALRPERARIRVDGGGEREVPLAQVRVGTLL